jgi:hypothetical protein
LSWSTRFDDPIELPNGRKLVTLEDAARYIQKLPKAQHDLPHWQDAVEHLMRASAGSPAWLMVTDTDGDPVRYRVFYDMYRDVADAAGVPKEVWNARARHGGGTEARASGASIEDTTDHMQKTDMEGTRPRLYRRERRDDPPRGPE